MIEADLAAAKAANDELVKLKGRFTTLRTDPQHLGEVLGKRFVLAGQLTRSARPEDVAHEVAVLSDNALDALGALTDYLR